MGVAKIQIDPELLADILKMPSDTKIRNVRLLLGRAYPVIDIVVEHKDLPVALWGESLKLLHPIVSKFEPCRICGQHSRYEWDWNFKDENN